MAVEKIRRMGTIVKMEMNMDDDDMLDIDVVFKDGTTARVVKSRFHYYKLGERIPVIVDMEV